MSFAFHRRLAADRAFTAIAVITLALGIGATTAIFSLIKSALLQPLPYSEADRVTVIWNTREADSTTWLSPREVFNYSQDATSFESFSAISETDVNLTGGQEPERVRAAAVTTDLFGTLGVLPRLGRSFVHEDGQPGANPVVMIGHGLWQRRFGGAASVIGTTIQVNGVTHTVVGILGAEFRLPRDFQNVRPTEVLVPLAIDPANLGEWGNRGLIAVARLRSGVSIRTATTELGLIGDRWIRAGYVADQGDFRFARSAVPVEEFITGRVRLPLLILLGAVAFVLLIAVANVANLLLAQADVRSRDLAIRSALGGSRRRLVQQLLNESVVLGVAGAVLGLLLAVFFVRGFGIIQPGMVPRAEDARIDPGVLSFAMLAGIVAGVLFGLAPALQLSRPNLTELLHDGGRSGTVSRPRQRLRKGFVIAQLALSLVLVAGAGLLTRSLLALTRVDLGFDPANVLTAQVQLPASEYRQPGDVVRFYRSLTERLEQIPGVQSAGAIRILPLTRTIGDWSITLESRPFSPIENPNGDFQCATPGYFAAMRLNLRRGRLLSHTDDEDAPMVVVVNETMAARYWPDEDPIGKRFHMGTANQPWMTIVGIVADVRHNAILEDPRAEMYVPHAQLPREIGGATRGMTIVVRTASDPLGMVAAVREAVRELDPNLPLSDVQPMDAVTARARSSPRFMAALLGSFASLALALAAIGVYSTISLIVTERAPEIGIRMALGAPRERILSMVLRDGLVLSAIGLGLGLFGAALLTRSLRGLLYGVTPLDALTFVWTSALLGGVALLASFVPASRAAKLDPMMTLRR